ncbi:hypothetical protein [Nocardioides sp. GCM10030258]|uniref:hypothetical protein n=1 Tax=unclassified Nocardioides TaxID=2615069 RepID=UPI00360CC231
MPTPPVEHQFNETSAAEAGRRSGEKRRKQTAREIATEATAQAVRDLLAAPPPLTPEQRDRLRVILGASS